MKLRVDIMGTDCTNRGLTSGKGTIILAIDERAGEGELKLLPGRGRRGYIAVKYGEYGYPMFGGHFIHSSDSQFTRISDQPIHVHDRYE